jgi:hypothetical protein
MPVPLHRYLPLYHLTITLKQGFLNSSLKQSTRAGCQWLTPIILASQEAEIRRILVQGQPGQIVLETLSQNYPAQKRAGGGTGKGLAE